MKKNRPKIGLALSGGSGRAIAHIGVLEVLRENQIPVDFITACSSGALIAAAYACDTMENLKQDWMRLNKGFFLDFIELNHAGTGILRTEKILDWVGRYVPNKNLEDVSPHLGFVCADIVSKKPVLLSLGNIRRAGQASCSVPGLFEPVEWGSKLLVDGGLFSIIPTSQAKEMGADIVIGVDIASTRYMFSKKFLRMRKGYRFIKKMWPVALYTKLHLLLDRIFTKSIDYIFYNQSDPLEASNFGQPGTWTILGRALDISILQNESRESYIKDCDYLISPGVKHLGKTDFENAFDMLEEGRRAATMAIPEIRRVIQEYEWRRTEGEKLKNHHV